ncbi:hypothetical protein F511_37923 [Dorcoceras hygrometricum]|uniref:Uncharacterized protein n=1 Tax=Dorcoceras hygrometricum TaxID=472368 RepID=A0A2Z7CIB4_9LAMI|nr:hypothetical protein F511_37923 [Dorcoceras hygrometricum]
MRKLHGQRASCADRGAIDCAMACLHVRPASYLMPAIVETPSSQVCGQRRTAGRPPPCQSCGQRTTGGATACGQRPRSMRNTPPNISPTSRNDCEKRRPSMRGQRACTARGGVPPCATAIPAGISIPIGYPRMSASGESSTTMHRLLHVSGSHPIPTPYDPK